jgi:hypothetical protein
MTNANVTDMTLGDEVTVQTDEFEVTGRVVQLELHGGVDYIATLEDTETRQNWKLVSDMRCFDDMYISEAHKPKRLDAFDVSIAEEA